MILVVDASVTIALIAADEHSDYAAAALVACGNDRVAVPSLWPYEIANTLVIMQRKGRIDDAAATYSSLVRNIPVSIRSDERSERRVLLEIDLARRHDLSTNDASYLALATTEGMLLATLDKKLTRAAQAEGVYFAA